MRFFSLLSLGPAIFLAGSLIGVGQNNLILASPLDSTQKRQPPASVSPSKPAQLPTEAAWPQFLESVRQKSLDYIGALPDFICRQQVQRMAKWGGLGSWQNVDRLVLEVSYYEKTEHYKALLKNDKPLRGDVKGKVGGIISRGDFGNALRLLFTPESNASFKREGKERIRGHAALRVSFAVPQKNSGYDVGFGDERVTVAYVGRCWIELATRQVVRLECEARDIPSSVPVRRSAHITDYDWVDIGGVQYWLPVRASVYLKLINDPHYSRMDFYATVFGGESSGGSVPPELEVRNAMEYKQYRKFGSEVRLVPE